jgi:uncharacterized protein YbcI
MKNPMNESMNDEDRDIVNQLARVASELQQQRTGHAHGAVNVILSDDTLVVRLDDALTAAELALSRDPNGACQVQEFHRQLFLNSPEPMRREIKQITGREVQEATAEIETKSGSISHTFTSGTIVQVYLLTPDGNSTEVESSTGASQLDADSIERAEDDGLRVTPPPDN